MRTFQYFAANRWHDPVSGAYIDSENPADGEVWARVPDCNAEDVARAANDALEPRTLRALITRDGRRMTLANRW